MSAWTDERVERLRKLWAEGNSASQIAAELGNGITRNAVVGKVHRLGLSGRVKGQHPYKPKSAPKPLAQRVKPNPRPRLKRTAIVANPLALLPVVIGVEVRPKRHVAEEVVSIPIPERVTLLDLREGMCKWPIGDPHNEDFGFCGAKKPLEAIRPYCTYHSRIAYTPSTRVSTSREDGSRRGRKTSGFASHPVDLENATEA